MRGLLALGLVVGIVGVAVGDETDPTAGKWVIESVTRDGKADDDLKGAVRVHAGNKYSVTPAAGSKSPVVSGTFTTEPTKTPATIDMKPETGRYKGKTLQGIYKLDAGALTVAFAEPGKDRPTGFEGKPGDGVVVAVHTKVK